MIVKSCPKCLIRIGQLLLPPPDFNGLKWIARLMNVTPKTFWELGDKFKETD